MSAQSPFVTPDQFAALRKELDKLKERVTAVANDIPPDYGIATTSQRGLIGPTDLAKLNPATATRPGIMAALDKAIIDAATPSNNINTLVRRDGVGGFAALGVNSGWHQTWGASGIVFSNNWANQPSSSPLRYKRDALGFVHLQGVVYRATGTATANEVMFTLPAGFRILLTTDPFVTATDTGAGRVTVNSDGTVRWQTGGVAFQTMGGIVFDAVNL